MIALTWEIDAIMLLPPTTRKGLNVTPFILPTLLPALAGLGFSAIVQAQELRPLHEATSGKIEFTSVARDSSTAQAVRKTLKFTESISGDLQFPDKPGTVPAMVVLHGSGGPKQTTATEWAPWIRSLGVATFTVDSFTSRSIANTAGDQSQISYPASALDALVALKVIAKHPRIDRNRIGVIGFSRGGAAAQMSAVDNFRKGVMDDDLKFAVHLAFYGSCSRVGKTTGAPIVHFFGADDDQFTEAGCKEATDFIKNLGGEVDLVIYKGARHGFDSNQGSSSLVREMMTVGNCHQMFDMDNNKFFVEGRSVTSAEYDAYSKTCARKGMWYQMQFTAKNASRDRVKYEVERVLKP
ncbi:MAG: dienelactone hydrolase family protein [Acidimicrobiia bacterium]